MVLGLLAAGAALAAGVAVADAQRDKNNKQWDPREGGYGGAKSVSQRVTQYITQGGRPEYQEATSQPKTLSVYNEPYAKQNGAEYGTFEYYKTPQGSYTRDLSQVANISMDDNGKITVTIPDKWQDDEQVKNYVDNYMLKTLSGNYKMNKDVQYQDPYDEAKQIKTREYVDKLNEALKFRVSALDATAPTKANLIARYGGTEEKNKVASGISTEDVIIMAAQFDKDDSWVPIPAYMLEAYPQLANLETFKNGFVQKKDFLENFYNIEDGKITEKNAYGIATTPEKMLSEIEDMSPEEVAKTVAFGNFIGQVDPKRSNWQQFLQAGNALSEGFYGGLYDWFVGTSDLVANVANFSWINGNAIETRDFWNGIVGGDTTEYMGEQMQQMAYTNKDALSKAQAGYVQGRLAGQAVDTVVSLIVVGEATKALSEKITSKIVDKGAEKVAQQMNESTAYTNTVETLAGQEGVFAKQAQNMANTSTGLATEAQARSAFLADINAQNAAIAKVASGSARYRAFFSQTWGEALTLYTKALGGTSAMLQSMGPAQLANIVNSASRIATTANFANTAVNVLGSMVMAAVISDKELTTKVLSSKATSDEAKSWIGQLVFDTAKLAGVSWVTGIAAEEFGATKFGQWAREASQKASQATSKFFNKVSHPWLAFMKWYLNNKAVAGKVSNATAASTEALKEAVLANEMRAYGANLSTQPGSYGEKILETYLDATGVQRGVTMSETLQNLARAGVVLDPATLQLSEFEAWQSDFAAAQNALTNWGDIQGNVSQVVHEFTNPDIQPAISQQMTEINKANTALLEEERKAGLLSDAEAKANKKLMKEDEGYLYAMHSPELSRYIVRGYELKVVANEARAEGVTDLENYQPYLDAKERFAKASEAVPEALRNIVDTQYVPALTRAEYNIVNVMVDDGVYSRSFVEAMRAKGKFGTDGRDWMRLVAKKDLPKGAYNPFSKMVKEDNTIALTRFRILEDDQITWPGNGLQELISEYGIARAEKKLVDAAKAATGKTTEIVLSSEKVRSGDVMKEYRSNFNSAVKQGFKSFTEDVEGTLAIGKKRTAEQKAYFKEVATTGGIETIDIDALRAVMRENNLPMADDIVDQETLDKFLADSTPEAKKLLLDVVGEKIIEPELTEEGWGDAWKNFSPNVRKILRGELEKTSLQTGYGIKDTRARLNAQVPGFDVLDWSLLGREHVNGLIPGGFYADMDDTEVKAYILPVKKLREGLGMAGNAPAYILPTMAEKFWPHINTSGGNAPIPFKLSLDSKTNESVLRFDPRGGHSMGSNAPDERHLHAYLEALETQGIENIPIVVSNKLGDVKSPILRVEKTGIADRGLNNIINEIDKAIATGKNPEFSVRDVSAALYKSGMTEARLKNRIRRSIPDTSEPEVASISEKDLDDLIDAANKYKWAEDEEYLKASGIQQFFENKIGKIPRDITADIQQAFSEYGQIPFFRGQRGLGEFNMNDLSSSTSQVGDAYWIAPNASYTDQYGKDKIMGTIPVKYFMSDKEKNEIFKQASKEASGLIEKRYKFMKEKFLETFKDSKDLDESWFEMNWPTIILRGDKLEFEGKTFDSGKWLKKALTKKEKTKLEELSKFLWVPSGENGRFFLVQPDKVGREDIKSYRALAEYAKKPIIDISEDGFANGTAFFYYKGVSPEFDKEIGQQLASQALFDRQNPQWTGDTIANAMEEYDGMSLDEMIDNVTMGQGFGEGWDDLFEQFNAGEISSSELSEEVSKFFKGVKKRYPGIGEVMQETWDNNSIQDLQDMKFSYWHPSTGHPTIDDNVAVQFLEEMGERAPQTGEPVPEGQTSLWAAIDPTNPANVPTEPQFVQPRRKVTYEDYRKSLAEESGLTDVILNAVRGEQFNKLFELKQKNATQYEVLANKVDRANAVGNDAIRQSQEVQVAADQFRQNIKDFENTALFTEKFSYMATKPADNGSLQAFVEENGLELPDDKKPLKSKIKHALWAKIQNGEELPKIKGITKKKLESITNSVQGWANRALATEAGTVVNGDAKAQVEALKKEFYKMLDGTELFKSASSVNALKYELDEDTLYNDIDDAIEGLVELVKNDDRANLAIEGMVAYHGYQMSPERYEFTLLSEVLSSEGKKTFENTIRILAHKIVDGIIPQTQIIVKGNETALYNKVEKAIEDRLESRLAIDKATLESKGEKAENATITELLEKYRSDIKGANEDKLVIKTTDENGEIQYERVSPALADIYNARPTYTPMSTPMQILNNLALLKKISLTDLNPKSFSKQIASDTALSFATVGALPGTLQAMRDEIAYKFGPAALRAMEKNDPLRYANIQAIAARENISEEKALERNLEALAKVQIPYTLLNRELLHQANVSKFGNEGAIALRRKGVLEKFNAGLRKVSDVLGTPQDKRETYSRLAAGEKAFRTALQKGYSLEQAENLREHALNTATTNFRQKHTVLNSLRSTVPYLTSGISGAKSFWKMFEMDPVGLSSRIFTGFIAPIMYFAGEIFSDENLRQKYKDLAEYEKENHIVIAVGGELILIPVGEELGQYTNLVMHMVETLYGENNYDFWNLMLNDLVNLIPGADLTGFTDPEMLEPLSGQTPNFLEIVENGIAKVLSSTMPPIAQSVYMANTGRDLYTGKPINTSYVTIDEDGNAVIMSKSTSEFAKALASVVGGDARIIEKVVSGFAGTTALHVLDTLTSAAQFIGSRGEEGSLTTGVEKTLSDLSAPYTAHGYNALERRWNSATSGLYREKESIEKSDEYIKYNQEIAKETDAKRRQTLINKRNNLFNEYQKKVEALVKGYRQAGGALDKWKFSTAVSLLAFEGAIQADRQFMELNTDYSDAYKQAMQTLYNMGITNPEGPSSLGYIYTDKNGNPQVKMWTPAQIQIMQNAFYEQNDIHAARIKAIIDDGTENSLKKQRSVESEAEQPYWNKAKMTDDDYDAIDDLRKAYNAKVVLALEDYMNTYGAANVLSNDAVIDYLNDIIRVPSSYEKVKGRFVSSGGGKLNKQTGFAESYIKTIFGVE